MGGQLGAVEMFETAEYLEVFCVVVFGLLGVGEPRVPQVLVEQ
jgi:hypothetical protein